MCSRAHIRTDFQSRRIVRALARSGWSGGAGFSIFSKTSHVNRRFAPTEKKKHAEQIAEKLIALGGKIPRVPELGSTHENSWQQLLTALDEENRSADHLIEQIRALESGYPYIFKLLQ